MKEDDVINLFRDLIPSVAQDVKLSIGDDGSVVEIDQEMELVTVLDTMTVEHIISRLHHQTQLAIGYLQ